MSRLQDSLKHLESTIDWTVDVLRKTQATANQLDNPAQLVCATFSMRQLNYADSVKTLVEAQRSESACVIARVMLEGTACLWWIVKSEHAEKQAENWVKNVYREALRLPKDLEVSAQDQSNIVKIKRDAENLLMSGETFKGNKWTIDEKNRPVTIKQIIEDFSETKMLPYTHLYNLKSATFWFCPLEHLLISHRRNSLKCRDSRAVRGVSGDVRQRSHKLVNCYDEIG